jgi:hypothetical protein
MLLVETTSCAYLFHGTSDQVNVYSGDPNALLYLDDQLIGRGNASATLDRDRKYTITAKAPGCENSTVITNDKFDPTSLLGILIDFGIISILVIDMAATGAAWKTYPLSYTVTPICPGETPSMIHPPTPSVQPAPPADAPAEHL